VFFGILTRQAIRRGTFSSVADLDAIGVYIDNWNDRCQPFTWTKDADTILAEATPPKNPQHSHHVRDAPVGHRPQSAA
jgi:hypothetical protein